MSALREAAQQALIYDPETGIFKWSDFAFHKRNRGQLAGSKKRNGYVEIQLNGKIHKAHRLAWLMSFGELPDGLEIDHIDGNRANNRLSNLRIVTRSMNQQNQRRARIDSASGMLGVSRNGSNWKAEIRVNKKKKNVGTYLTPEQAYAAYVNAKRRYHEGCTL
jgi:hypothetical protein